MVEPMVGSCNSMTFVTAGTPSFKIAKFCAAHYARPLMNSAQIDSF